MQGGVDLQVATQSFMQPDVRLLAAAQESHCKEGGPLPRGFCDGKHPDEEGGSPMRRVPPIAESPKARASPGVMLHRQRVKNGRCAM
jgi:hypothetical protein